MPALAPKRISLSFLVAALFVLAGAALGALAGGAWLRFFASPPADGWSAIADTLGALMVGGGAGLVASLVALRPLWRRGPGALAKAAGAILGLALALLAALFLARPERPADVPVERPRRAFEPTVQVEVRIVVTDQRLRALAATGPDAPPLRLAAYVVQSYGPAGPHLDIEELGPSRRFCSAPLAEADLRTLIDALRPATALDGMCRTPRDDLPIVLNWTLGDASPGQGGAWVEADCLPERPALTALIAALDALAARSEDALQCRPI